MPQPVPDLPTAAPQVTATLEKTHQQVVFTPNNDPSLAYKLVLPKDWKAESDLGSGPGGLAQPQLIGLFAPKVDPGAPFVSVSVTRMPIEVNIEDWIDYVCAQDGWQVFASRWLKTPRGLVADTGAEKKTPRGRDIMRVMGFADNGRIFLASGVAGDYAWDKWKNDLLIACISLELVAPTGDDSLEPLLEYEGGDPAFGVAFPGSWSLEEKPPSKPGKSAVDIRLTDKDQLLAYVRVKATDLAAYPDTTVDSLFAQARKELQSAGFSPRGNFVFPAVDHQGDQVPAYKGTAVAMGQIGNRKMEARLGFRLVPGMAFAVSLLSVVQEENPLLWMRSKRAFELICRLNWKVDRPAS